MQGQSLGPYRVDRELGAGGMGRVFAATVEDRCPGLSVGTHVALKVVHPHLLEQPGFFRRFLREAEIGASVRHPNVVRTHLADALGSEHFLVMEYVEGQTLRDLLHELERVPEELCRHVGREICKGLAAIHGAGVVHRDLKPENVLITEDHVVKVMDLGVARLQDEAVRLSQSGAFVGSLQYAAPESFKDGGEGVDGRADLHSLGLVLYELACGINPYVADDVPKTVRKVLHEEPRRLGDANPQLSPFFEEVVHCLLAKDREQRFASASALLEVLETGEDSTWWNQRASIIRRDTKRPLRRIRIPRETAVYGREKELAKLTSLYQQAKSGEGQVVLIEGEAGIGKSRLVDELIGRLQADGEDLNFLFGSYPPGGAALAAGGFSSAYREQFGSEGSAPYLSATPLLVPGFDAVLRGEPSPEDALGLTKDSLETCFVHATRALAAERTTVALIDDLHFAPEDARALFTSVALAVPGHRILLLGTTRPGVPEEWVANLTRPEHVAHMQVDRLGPKDLVRLLQDSFRSERLAEQLGIKIALKSDGNPFFAFEIIRGLREGRFITQADDGTWVGTKVIDDIQIPSSVLDLVNARVASLSQEERDLLDVAACWGYEFDPALVAEVVGIARIPLYKRLAQIERAHRLVRSSGRSFVFDHHQVQEALYGSLPEVLREEYHAALADALETRTKSTEADPETLDGALCVDLAEHYLKGARSESALRYLPAAQTHLTKGYLHAQIVALTERALAVPDLLVGTERAKALLKLGGANGPLDTMGRRARQEECAREAERLAEEAEDDELRGQAANALGTLFWRTSRHTDAESAYRRALDLALARGDRKADARATGNLGGVFWSQGRLREAQEHYERSLALCREIGYRAGEANATGNLGNVSLSEGRLREAREHFEPALALCREIGDRRGAAIATGNLGTVFFSEGRLREAREHLERTLALCREIGNRAGEAIATRNLGNVFLSEGRLREAREHYEQSLALCCEIGNRVDEAMATGNLGVVFEDQGRLREAQKHYERSLALCREIGNRQGEAVALVNLGLTWFALGDRSRARGALDESLALCREIGTQYPEGCGLLVLGRLADEVGDPAEAFRLTKASLALRRKIGHGDGVADSLIELGDLRRRAGDADAARTSLDEALRLSREQGRASQVALALALLAGLPGGDGGAAETALAEAGKAGESTRVRWLLFRATGDRAHLEEAKRLLDESLAKNPPEYHESMCQNLRVNREILAAWREEFGDGAGGEVETRAG